MGCHLVLWGFFAFCFASVCKCSEGATDKSASGSLYTLSHIEGLAGFSFGTTRLALDMPVALYDSATMRSVSGIKLLQRRVVVVKVDSLLDESNPADTEFFVNSARVAGIVYILPDIDAALSSKTRDLIEVLKTDLMSRVWAAPIFLTRSSEASPWMTSLEMRTGTDGVKGLLPSIVTNGILRDVINLKVSSVSQTVQQPPPPGKNISGWLKRKISSEETPLPILAVITHYDDFNLSSAFAKSAAGGSGLIAMLEIANRLSSVFRDHESLAQYDVLFLATGGSTLGYRGLQQWLADTDESVLTRIQFALCLDSLMPSQAEPGFTLHSSRDLQTDPTNNLVNLLAEQLNGATGSSKPSLAFKTKKVRVYEQLSMPWQHEHFAALRILSASLSTYPEATPYMKRQSFLDSSTDLAKQQQAFSSIIDTLSTAVVSYVFNASPEAIATATKAAAANLANQAVQKSVDEFGNTARFFEGMPPSRLEKYTTSLESKFTEMFTAGSVSRSAFKYTPSAAERRILREHTDSDAQMALRVHFDSLKEVKVFYHATEMESEPRTVQFTLKTSKGFLFDLVAMSFSAMLLGMTYVFLEYAFDSKFTFKVPQALLDASLRSGAHHD